MKLPSLPHIDLQNVERMVQGAAAAGLEGFAPTLVKRSSSASTSCSVPSGSGLCETPASEDSDQTMAIVLGVVIPLSCAIAVLIFLHRRHMKKQRLEDINDPHKSLDFGLDGVPTSKPANKKSRPEMAVTDLGANPPGGQGRSVRGLSMDMGMGSPYLLPAGLHNSRESLHSMARSHHEHDPYRPVTMLRPMDDNESLRSGRTRDDKGSMMSLSTGHLSSTDKAGLLSNARPMSQSNGRRAGPASLHDSNLLGSNDMPPHQMQNPNQTMPPRRQPDPAAEKPLPNIGNNDIEPFPLITPPEPVAKEMPPPRKSSVTAQQQFPSRKASRSASLAQSHQSDYLGPYGEEPPLPSPPNQEAEPEYDINPHMIFTDHFDIEEPTHTAVAAGPADALHAPAPVAGQRLSVLGLRPLPPDVPDDNPEQRANRIRSFYKEYFDDSRPAPAQAQYEGDYYDDYLEGAVYDPTSGGFFMAGPKPFAQPIGRRAMTPPPRAPPRSNANSAMGVRHHSTQSAGRIGNRSRAQSAPKKKLPPPMPLHSLPTPHALKGDIEVFNPIDFAPPSSFRQQQNGSRPDTPTGIARPYSPAVRSFTPLASSFDNLSPMPSPHLLRKSGTFTALDFAPPSKLRDPNMLSAPGSDAGSIRSFRSGISTVQTNAIRQGAYRVSRIPKEVVSTRDDLTAQLRPKMDMISPA